MFSGDDDGSQGLVMAVVFGLVALVVSVVIGVAVMRSRTLLVPEEVATVPVRIAQLAMPVAESDASASASSAQAAADAASVKVEHGVVKFYFTAGKADLSAEAPDALAELVRVAGTTRKLLVTGFHDASGKPAANAALALKRAETVQAALRSAGVAASQIELKNPELAAVSDNAVSNDAEARRVEVSVQ